MERTAIK